MADTVGQYNPFRYRSYYYDSETGLYYLQSRYYDPEVGRFINADGIVGANGGIQGYNMFAYCNNNPIVYYDPSGQIVAYLLDNGCDGTLLNSMLLGAEGGCVAWGAMYYQSKSKKESVVDKNKNVISNSLYDNDRFENKDSWHEQIVAYDISGPNFDPSNGSLELIGVSANAVTGGWEWEYFDLSLLDFGHAEAQMTFGIDGFDVSAMASVWSPSIAFEFFGVNVEVGLEVFGLGGKFERSDSLFTVGFAAGYGGFLTISK